MRNNYTNGRTDSGGRTVIHWFSKQLLGEIDSGLYSIEFKSAKR